MDISTWPKAPDIEDVDFGWEFGVRLVGVR